MTRPLIALCALAAVVAATGCDDGVPTVRFADDPVVPGLDVHRGPATLSSPLTVATNGGERQDDEGACEQWDIVAETFDQSTGRFSGEYVCPSGGDIASYTVDGVDNLDGTGHYTQTRQLRDGREVVWEFVFTYSYDGADQSFTGTSSLGEYFWGDYRYEQNGDEHIDEEWRLVEGTYRNRGVLRTDGLFIGTRAFDDPDTEVSPDWMIALEIDDDGAYVQTVDHTQNGIHRDYTYVVKPDGTAVYVFENDLVDSLANPDFVGEYIYNPDGSGAGSYLQRFDDGSTNLVEDVFLTGGGLIESWTFDDAATERATDQTGELVYDLAARVAEGFVVWVMDDGAERRCALSVNGDGVTTIADCGGG